MALNIIDFPTKRVLPPRTKSINSVVIHTTGETDLDKILAWYTNTNGLQPHYLIETTGTIRRIVDEARIAWHTKIEPLEASAYSKGWDYWSRCTWIEKSKAVQISPNPYAGYTSWSNTWRARKIEHPLQLVTGSSPNSVSLGIELQQPDKNSITPTIFTPEQYDSLDELLGDICVRHDVPRKRNPILGHYDCSPMRRCTIRGGWDPGDAFDWARVIPTNTL